MVRWGGKLAQEGEQVGFAVRGKPTEIKGDLPLRRQPEQAAGFQTIVFRMRMKQCGIHAMRHQIQAAG